jgi:hypothetical protein
VLTEIFVLAAAAFISFTKPARLDVIPACSERRAARQLM